MPCTCVVTRKEYAAHAEQFWRMVTSPIISIFPSNSFFQPHAHSSISTAFAKNSSDSLAPCTVSAASSAAQPASKCEAALDRRCLVGLALSNFRNLRPPSIGCFPMARDLENHCHNRTIATATKNIEDRNKIGDSIV